MNLTVWTAVQKFLTEQYYELLPCLEGKKATYIPALEEADERWFAISAVTVEGDVFEIGDTEKMASIQSGSKTLNMALATQEHGTEKIMERVNVEASGRSFDDAALDDQKRPFNSLINAGAILTTSLIMSHESPSKRFGYIKNKWSEVAGEHGVGYDNEVYLSERDTCDQNLSIVYKMMAEGSYPEDFSREEIMKSFELYLQCCSITMNSTGLARYAATLANSGILPGSNDRFLDTETVQNVLSVMDSAGMYDYSGTWCFLIGVPAKSGVAGLVYIVIPRVMGLCIYSPNLDKHGNSVRAIKLAKAFARKFNIHKFNFAREGLCLRTASQKREGSSVDQIFHLIHACSKDDEPTVRQILDSSHGDLNINRGDYDDRCPIHLATERAGLPVVRLLLRAGADPLVKDGFGCSPITYAAKHQKIRYFYLFLVQLSRKAHLREAFEKLRGPTSDSEESTEESPTGVDLDELEETFPPGEIMVGGVSLV